MLLATTSAKIEFVLGENHSTNQIPGFAAWFDSASTPAASSAGANSNDTTQVTLVAPPGASTIRQINEMTICNTDTINHTVTVRFNDGTNTFILQKVTLPVGYTLVYSKQFGWNITSPALAVIPTRQVLNSGTAYTTPSGVRQLRIRMVGGGGGGAGSGTAGGTSAGAGGTTSFNSINANGGAAGSWATGQGALGGASGTGSASVRIAGGGGAGIAGVNGEGGGKGGGSAFGDGPATGTSFGTLGAGVGGSGASMGGGTGNFGGSGGGAGEYVELLINNPAASYTYAIGAAGTAGGAGSGGNAGSAGGAGLIIVDEFY